MPSSRTQQDRAYRTCLDAARQARTAENPADCRKFVRAALRAREKCAHGYRRAAAAAWPLRAMIERDEMGEFERVLRYLLEHAEAADPPVSRADALLLLWQAVYPSPKHRERLFSKVVAACHRAGSWKGDVLLGDVALIIASEDSAAAAALAKAMPDGKVKCALHRKLERGESLPPSTFFRE